MSASFIGAKISWSRPSRYENSEPGGKAGRSGMTSSGVATGRLSYRVFTVGRSPGGEQTASFESDSDGYRSSLGLTSRKGVEGASLPAVDEHLEVALGIRHQRLEAAIDRALERNAIGDERLEVDLALAQELDRRDVVVVHPMGQRSQDHALVEQQRDQVDLARPVMHAQHDRRPALRRGGQRIRQPCRRARAFEY